MRLIDKRKKAEADKLQVPFRFFVDQNVGASVSLVWFYAGVSIQKPECRNGPALAGTLAPTLICSRAAPQFVSDHHGFCDFPHGFTSLPALSLQCQIGLLFVEREITL